MEQFNDCLQLGCFCRSAVQADGRYRDPEPVIEAPGKALRRA